MIIRFLHNQLTLILIVRRVEGVNRQKGKFLETLKTLTTGISSEISESGDRSYCTQKDPDLHPRCN